MPTLPTVPTFGTFFSNSDGESVVVMADALALNGNPHIGSAVFYYNATDAPEGGWMCWLFDPAGSNSANAFNPLTLTVTLPRTLSAGTYYAFVYGIAYDTEPIIDITLGGATSNQIIEDDRDFSKYWSARLTVVTVSPDNTVDVNIRRNTGSVSLDQRLLIRGVYITSNPAYTMTSDSIAVDLTFPTVMDNSAPVKGNLLTNGGFETSIGAEWGIQGRGGGEKIPLSPMWDNTGIGHSGAGCLRFTNNAADRQQTANNAVSIISRIYHLKANKKYTLTGWFKRAGVGTAVATLQMRTAFLPPNIVNDSWVDVGFHAPYEIHSTDDTIGTSWHKVVCGPAYLVKYPTTDYQVWINLYVTDGTVLLIDDLQLEEDTETAYAPASLLDAAIHIDDTAQVANVFWDSETVAGTLIARNDSAGTLTGTFHYEFYDFMNRVVASGTVALSVTANTTHTEAFNLDNGLLGIFRLVTWIEGRECTEREITYSIIPEPPTQAADLTAHLGAHVNLNAPWALSVMQKIGVKWTRDLSPGPHMGRWSVVEPVEGVITFYDAEVTSILAHGLTPMCVLGTNDFWPAWADSGDAFDITKWGQFCTAMATHYSPSIRYWECWNEPGFLNSSLAPDFYAQMLKTMADTIHAVDPAAKIVGMGGIPLALMQDFIAAMEARYPTWDWPTDVPYVSTHAYSGAVPPESFIVPIEDLYGVEVWNTETATWDKQFRQGATSNFLAPGKPVIPYQNGGYYYTGLSGAAAAVTENFCRCIASGFGVYFYYVMGQFVDPAYLIHHPTVFDYDGTIKAKGISLAIASSLIGRAVGLGNAADPGDSSYFLTFDNGVSAPVAMLMSSDREPRTVTLSLSHGQFEVLDMMGNSVAFTGSAVQYGRIPIFLRGIGITAATLEAALGSGVVVSRADTTAPNLAITDGPRGVVTSGVSFRLRYIAIDDTSYPNLGEINTQTNVLNEPPNPHAILYTYKLQGYNNTWAPWTAETYIDYPGLAAGTYIFSVIARDEAGNLSAEATRTITVEGDAIPITPVILGDLSPTTTSATALQYVTMASVLPYTTRKN